MTAAHRRGKRPDEDGFTLIELLVSMALFSVLLAVFGVSINIMFKDVRHQLGQSDDLDATRKALSRLDQQVRYASAINTPGSTGSAPNVTYWVEWQSGNVGQQQTCTQWRLLPTGNLQFRTWQPSLTGGTPGGLTTWSTQATGIAGAAGSPFAFPPYAVSTNNVRQQLVVSFVSTHGAPKVSTPSQVTLTARNTTSSAPLLAPICQEVARS